MDQMKSCSTSTTTESTESTTIHESSSASCSRNITEMNEGEQFSHLDGYNLKNDPRYQALCRNRCKTITYQSFKFPSRTGEEKIRAELSQILEYDFERRLPMRRTNSFENFTKGFGSRF